MKQFITDVLLGLPVLLGLAAIAAVIVFFPWTYLIGVAVFMAWVFGKLVHSFRGD